MGMVSLANLSLRLALGVVDNVQVYNLPKFDGFHPREHPEVLEANIKEIEEFSRVCTFLVMHLPHSIPSSFHDFFVSHSSVPMSHRPQFTPALIPVRLSY